MELIAVRAPAGNPELPAANAASASAGTLSSVQSRNQLAIEQTRANLDKLRTQRHRMLEVLDSMRHEVAAARTLRETLPVEVKTIGVAPSTLRLPLSRRELVVLEEVAAGLPNKQVAIHLGISERTVRNHMTRIFAKLRVNSRTEAVLKALRQGLLTV